MVSVDFPPASFRTRLASSSRDFWLRRVSDGLPPLTNLLENKGLTVDQKIVNPLLVILCDAISVLLKFL